MKKRIQIFVEGDADVAFFSSILAIHFGIQSLYLEPEKKKKHHTKDLAKYYDHDSIRLDLIPMGGCTNLVNLFEDMKKIHDFENSIGATLVVMDADTLKQKFGTFNERVKYIESIRATFKSRMADKYNKEYEFHYYLLPFTTTDANNTLIGKDGDLETLLCSIAREEPFQEFVKCREAHINCLKRLNDDDFWLEHEERKSLVFDFIQIHQGKGKAKERDRDYVSKLWDFNHEELAPLIKFLKRFID